MASAEEKANETASDSSSKADDATTETLTTETHITSSIMVSVKETLVTSGGTDMVEDIEGVNDEEKALIAVTNEQGERDEEGDEASEKEEEVDDESGKEEEQDDESENEEESDKENVGSEVEANQEGEGDGEKEDKKEGNVGEEHNAKEVVVKPKEGGRKPRRRNKKKKIEQKSSEIVKMDGNKPESSNKKKASKKVEGMGMIFMCSSKTKTDCFRYKLLGLPAAKKDQVEKIYKGMRLFLFDIDLRLMYGIFKAAAPGGYNIEPKAFKSAFPSQVRFTVMEDCFPLAEEKFKKVLKENYYSRNRFNCQLTSEQVKKLCNLFTIAGKTPTSKSGKRSLKAEVHPSVDQGRRKRRAREEERRPVPRRDPRREHMYREPPRSPPRRLAQLPPLAPAPVYVYERPMERDPYLQDPVLEHRGLRYLDSEPRRHRDEIRVPEPYIVYREAPSYQDTGYSTSRPVERAPPSTLPLEYRPLSRDYHSDASRSAAYQFHGNVVRGYRAVDYSPLPEYQSRHTNYRY